MLGHVGLNVPDLDAAKSYYDRLMPLLDFETFLIDTGHVSYRPVGKPGTVLFLYATQLEGNYSRHRTGLQHLAFMVPTRTRVHEVHELVGEIGLTSVIAPREFPEYPPPYYATFWEDIHGFMLEAVCHYDAV